MRIDLARPDVVNDVAHRDLDAVLPTMRWSAWSCDVRIVVSDPEALAPATADVMALMRRVDAAASRFRNDSDLSWANLNHGRPIAVSRLLIELVTGALDGARRSGGALDPTIGRDLIGLGYDRDIFLLTDQSGAPDGPSATGVRPNFRQVRVAADIGLLTVPRGAALDLGATAKAQTADLAATALHRRYGGAVLVEIGGDLAVAGDRPDWQIMVSERAGAPGQQIALHRGGLATSTTTIRRWQRGSKPVHHIIDPATGRPADGPWRTVTVAAPTALAANVCSTAAIVLGDAAPAWLAQQRVAARLVDQLGAVHTLGGWPC